MFYELIYTRCGKGINIESGSISTEANGFKTYAVSEELLNDKDIDRKYLGSIVRMTAPNNLSGMTDDAYMYFVPQKGVGYIMNFHPVSNDSEEGGMFSRRGGNYINQLYIGTIDEDYPYELFGSEGIWDAKGKGQAYYYETEAGRLPTREKLIPDTVKIGLDELSEFVTGWRLEAVKKAVAFLLSQYSSPLENRKYLVIREANTANIELWIAAIESAFSPRMASGLPFATRMTDFINKNRYAISTAGVYQDQIDLQNPNQKRLFRAMIVGADSRDGNGVKETVAKVSTPYVLLDGVKKVFSFDTSVDHPMYQLITSYSDEHIRFCRQFLQMFDLREPGDVILQLYEAFKYWEAYEEGCRLEDLLRTIRIIRNYTLVKTPFSESVYNQIKKKLIVHMKQNVSGSAEVIGWIGTISATINDNETDTFIVQLISNAYIESLFSSPTDRIVRDLLHLAQQYNNVNNVYSRVLSDDIFNKKNRNLIAFSEQEWSAFLSVLLEAPDRIIENNINIFWAYVSMGIKALFIIGLFKKAERIAAQFHGKMPQVAGKLILSEARSTSDKHYSTYLVSVWATLFADTFAADNELTEAYTQLKKYGLEKEIPALLARRISADMTLRDKERFLKDILCDVRYKGMDLTPVLTALDVGLSISDKRAVSIATLIQQNLNGKIRCINSAHIYALAVLDDLQDKNSIGRMKSLFVQGFPSLEDETYSNSLMKKITDSQMPMNMFCEIVINAAKSRFYTEKIVEKVFQDVGSKRIFFVEGLFQTAEEMQIYSLPNANQLFSVIVTKCAQFKSFDKNMSWILNAIKRESTVDFLKFVFKRAKDEREQNQKPSLIGRLFGKGAANSSDDKDD